MQGLHEGQVQAAGEEFGGGDGDEGDAAWVRGKTVP